jgi:hypothetical protein
MNQTIRLALVLALLGWSAGSVAQAPDSNSAAEDPAKPIERADPRKATPDLGAGAPTPAQRAKSRCDDLKGTLRERCILEEQGTSSGGTTAPETVPPDRHGAPSPPPPQNPQ